MPSPYFLYIIVPLWTRSFLKQNSLLIYHKKHDTLTNFPTGAEALLIALQTPTPKGSMGVPVLLWGKPGIGKSSFLEGLNQTDFPVLTLIASIHDPTDFSGLPIHHEGQVRYAVPEWVNKFSDDGDGLLFLDELTTAPPSVQAALLRVVLERRVGFHPLPPGVRIVAAANPPDMITGGWELSPPLRNRFVHLHWDMPTSVYLEALQSGFEVATLPKINKEEHAERLPVWKVKVGAFLKRTPNLLSTSPEDDIYGFASPRTWDFVAQLLTSCDLLGQAPTSEQKASKACISLVKGCIGEGAALPFLSFLKDLKLPDPAAVLDNKEAVKLSGLDDSELYIFFSTLGDELMSRIQKNSFLKSTHRFFELTQQVFDNGRRDLIYVSLRKAVRGKLLEYAVESAADKSPEDSDKMLEYIQDLFSDEVFSKYIEVFEK